MSNIEHQNGKYGVTDDIANYISLYGTEHGVAPIEEPSAGEVLGQVADNAGSAIDAIGNAYDEQGFGGLLGSAVDGVLDSVQEFAGDCADTGVKCLTPEFVTHGTDLQQATVDQLLGDTEAQLQNEAESAVVGAETLAAAASFGLSGAIIKGTKEVGEEAVEEIIEQGVKDVDGPGVGNNDALNFDTDAEAGNTTGIVDGSIIDYTQASDLSGVPPSVMENIKNLDIKPDPESYMAASQIAQHADLFDEGVIRFTSRKSYEKRKTLGPDGGFVIPKKEFDKIMEESNGDLRIVESRLGLSKNYLANDDVMVAFIKHENTGGVRIPTGNEGGANSQWIPGGYTSGGTAEAVMNFSTKPPFIEINIR